MQFSVGTHTIISYSAVTFSQFYKYFRSIRSRKAMNNIFDSPAFQRVLTNARTKRGVCICHHSHHQCFTDVRKYFSVIVLLKYGTSCLVILILYVLILLSADLTVLI